MSGIDNLNKLNASRTQEERIEAARKAGKASVVARRRKKSMREWAEAFGSLKISVASPDGKDINTDLDGAAVFAQYQRASKGDTSAARFLADLKGELVERDVNVKLDDGVQVIVRTTEEKEKIKEIGKMDI